MPDGLDSFLSLRVTLRNVLLLGMFATIWAVIFRVCGLYNGARIRRAADERLRVIGACSLGSMVGLLLPAMSNGGGLKARDLGLFWLLTTAGTLVLREVRRRVDAWSPAAAARAVRRQRPARPAHVAVPRRRFERVVRARRLRRHRRTASLEASRSAAAASARSINSRRS